MSKFGFGLESISADDIGKLAAKGAGLGAIRAILSETLLALILLMFIVQSRSGLFGMVGEQAWGCGSRPVTGNLEENHCLFQYQCTYEFRDRAAHFSCAVSVRCQVRGHLGAAYLLLNFIPIVGLLIAVLVVVILYIVTVGLSAKMGWLLLALMAECACQLYFLFSFLSL